MPLRLAKLGTVVAIAAIMTLVAFGNVTDYDTNFQFVEHVLSMDTIFPGSTIGYRAIRSPLLHHIAYASIIATEATTAVLCWIGAAMLMWRLRAGARAFNRAKHFAIAGLTLGFLLFQFGFLTIGGEWFGMWMSGQWNGQPSAFRYAMMIIAVLLFLSMRDEELEKRASS